jgi:hypothetical protein
MDISVTKKKGASVSFGNLDDIEVVVGIPQRSKSRGRGKINNAELLFIHTNGSPVRNIPPRPVIEPSIEANQEYIAAQLAVAAKAALDNDPDGVMQAMNRAGQVAANGAKQWFFDRRNGWKPLSPATIRAKGSSQPLIDTGSMRRAITYVVNGEFKKRKDDRDEDEEERRRREEEERQRRQSEEAEEAPETEAAEAEGAVEEAAEGAIEAGEALGEGAAELGEAALGLL